MIGLVGAASLGCRRAFRAGGRGWALAALAGLCCAVLLGAFGAGDSLKASLKRAEAERLGLTAAVLNCPWGPLEEEALDGLHQAAGGRMRIEGIAIAKGKLSKTDGSYVAVDVLGVDPGFFGLAPRGDRRGLGSSLGGGIALPNRALARALGLVQGEEVLLTLVSRGRGIELDPFLGKRAFTSRRFTTGPDIGPEEMGSFSLETASAGRPLLFIDRNTLSELRGGGASLDALLAAPVEGEIVQDAAREMNAALEEAWDLRWAGYSLNEAGGMSVLRHRGIFMKGDQVQAIMAALPEAMPAASYFADSVSFAGRSSPFAFICALDQRLFSALGGGSLDTGGPGMPAAALDWLSRDLGCGPGRILDLHFRSFTNGKLVPGKLQVILSSILSLPASGRPSQLARALEAPFPGISGSPSCHSWDPGIDIDMSLVRPADEAYWKDRGGTPKLYLPLRAAAVFHGGEDAVSAIFLPGEVHQTWAMRLSRIIGPSKAGYSFSPRYVYMSPNADSFSGLFSGLSLYLILSPIILMALVISAHLAAQRAERGLLSALGFSPTQASLAEFLSLGAWAVAGIIAGLPLGLLYQALVLWALNGPWSTSVQDSVLRMGLRPISALAAMGISAGACLSAYAFSARRRGLAAPAILLRGLAAEDAGKGRGPIRGLGFRAAIGAACLASAIVLILIRSRTASPALACFGAGSLIIAAAMAAWSSLLHWLDQPTDRTKTQGPAALALRNMASRGERSLLSFALISMGFYLAAAVGGNPWLIAASSKGMASGTGGYDAYLETAIPFDPERLETSLPASASILPLWKSPGDDSSCLSIRRAARPLLIGIDTDRAIGRFHLASAMDGAVADRSAMDVLNTKVGDGEVAALADVISLEWNLGMKPGQCIDIEGEGGRVFRLRIVGALAASVFQEGLVLRIGDFRRIHPSLEACSAALIDIEDEIYDGGTGLQDVLHTVGRALRAEGALILPASARLQAFAAVERSYLGIFLLLGGLGLLLGTAGYAAVQAMRSASDTGRRALLGQIGMDGRRIGILIFTEAFLPSAAAIVAGWAASLAAIMTSGPSAGSGIAAAGLLAAAALMASGLASAAWAGTGGRARLPASVMPD